MTPSEAIDRIKALLFNAKTKKFNYIKEAKEYMAAFPLIAQSLVDKSGKKIQLRSAHGVLGMTDGTTIYVTPTPMPNSAGDLESFLIFIALKMGLIHHEIGHVNHTDFGLKRSNDQLSNHLSGLIEDIRQERVHMARFKSARKYLDALEIAMIHQGITGTLKPDAPPIHVFTSWLYYRLRYEYSGQLYFQPYLDEAQPIFEQTFGLGIVPKIENLLIQVPKLQNTQDAIDLSDEIRNLIVDEIKELEKQAKKSKKANQQQSSQANDSQSPDGQQSGDDQGTGDQQASQQSAGQSSQSDDQPNDDGSGSDANDQNGQNADGQPQAGNNNQQQTDDSSSANSSGGSQTDPQPAQQLANMKDMLKGKDSDQAMGDKDMLVKELLQALSDHLQQHGADLLFDNFEADEIAENPTSVYQLHTGNQSNLQEAVGVVSKLSSTLRKQLQADSLDKTSRGLRGNKILNKALLKVPLGDARIFKRIHRARRLDTAVCMMTDISGSMQGKKIELANQAIFATACAIERLPQCKVAVGTFPLNQVVLPFGMRASKNKARFMLRSTGCTPMHEGISMGFALLNRRREERKVLFVVTDGEPDSLAAAKNTLMAYRRYGIEVYAIGIQTDAVKDLFENWAVIKQIGDLPKVVFDMLKGKAFQEVA